MGLFDDDPQKQAQLMMAFALLGGAPGGRKNFGADLSNAGLLGMQGYNNARALQQRQLEEEQQRAYRAMQMEQMKRQGDREAKLDALPGQFNMPGNLTPNDDEGNAMPPAPTGFNFPGYANALTAIDPQKGLAMRAQLAQMGAKERVTLKPGETLGTFADGKFSADYTAPAKPEGPKVGQTREVKSGGNIITYEWDGKGWTKIAAAPQFKPDGPEKPAAPQLYESPNGPVWVTPPGRGGPNVPVTGPDGQPLPGKKREQQLTESQAKGTLFLGQMRDAEESIKALPKFDPATMGNQASIAAAFRAKEAGPLTGLALNSFAGKDAQQYAQAAEQWSEAFLRIKTGAASTRDEVLRNARTFFPQPGDQPPVIAQKNAARAAATRQMEIIAGHGTQQLEAQSPGAWSIRPLP